MHTGSRYLPKMGINECIFYNLKTKYEGFEFIGIFHQVRPWHLQRYCDKFAARSYGEFDAGPGDLQLVRLGVLIALIVDTTHSPKWLVTEPICADCRLSGTNVEPSFWPN
jgi:hypothetical protein